MRSISILQFVCTAEHPLSAHMEDADEALKVADDVLGLAIRRMEIGDSGRLRPTKADRPLHRQPAGLCAVPDQTRTGRFHGTRLCRHPI